jgi:vacuolar-type H+-ATPase subunit H
MSVYEPRQFEQIERDERDARLRLAEARERAKMNEGEAPSEHHALIQKLEDEWHKAREHLEHARHGKQD